MLEHSARKSPASLAIVLIDTDGLKRMAAFDRTGRPVSLLNKIKRDRAKGRRMSIG